MKLLFLSNFLPPYSLGGYEEWCWEVAYGLVARGHRVHILTSRHGSVAPTVDGNLTVERALHMETALENRRNLVQFFIGRARREKENVRHIRDAIVEVSPDAVVVWGMWNLARSLPALVETLCPEKTVYYLGDYWPTLPSQWHYYWAELAPTGPARWIKGFLRRFALSRIAAEQLPRLNYPYALFASQYLHTAILETGIKMGVSLVVAGGVDLAQYRRVAEKRVARSSGKCWRVLVAGRLVPEKGIHTVVEALGKLPDYDPAMSVELTIAGVGDLVYEMHLRHLVSRHALDAQVHFVGRLPKSQMPQLYLEHDVMVFPSSWPEPFGRVVVEAMAAGLPVIGTGTGGSGDLLQDGHTGLRFPPLDSSALALQLIRLYNDRVLQQELVLNARAFSEEFQIDNMTEQIEQFVAGEVVRGRGAAD